MIEKAPFDAPRLDLPEGEIDRRFEALQQKLAPLWAVIDKFTDVQQTVVVVPSLTVDYSGLEGSLLQAYEERFLFLLLLLRQPKARLVYVTSQPIYPNVVDYYLGLLPGVVSSHARARLHLVSTHNGGAQPLSVKLLERPRLLAQIRGLISDPGRAHLVVFNTTKHERDLALRLGIPLYGADPRHLYHGTKSGARKLFAEAGIAHPLGFEDLRSFSDVVSALGELRSKRPGATQALLKHNDGVSGEGNAVIELGGLDANSRQAIEQRVRGMQLESSAYSVETFLDKLTAQGGIVEERIVGEEFKSPSAQLRVTPTGRVQLLSTHDQLLGGAQGQTYIGCLFPADPGYAGLLGREALKLSDRLVKDGVLGRFAVDFVCAKNQGAWNAYAIELNLRKGGTTHPFLTLQFLTDGTYDGERGEFRTKAGRTKCYVATDCLQSPAYRVFTPDDLFDIVVRHRLHYDPTSQTGVVLHMLSAVGDRGRLGLTALSDTLPEAKALYAKTQTALDSEAELARRHAPL